MELIELIEEVGDGGRRIIFSYSHDLDLMRIAIEDDRRRMIRYYSKEVRRQYRVDIISALVEEMRKAFPEHVDVDVLAEA